MTEHLPKIAENHIYDTIILGGGPAGYTAALYAARSGLDTLLFERGVTGGQMALTQHVDNYPGFDAGIDGPALGAQMQRGAARFGAKTAAAQIISVSLQGQIKQVQTNTGSYYARTIIAATGADPRPLGLPDEARWIGRGLHLCATCDGRFYQGRDVAVIGGGNSAAEDALALSRLCRTVYLVHRRQTLRAERVYQAALAQAANIRLILPYTAVELLGESVLTGISLRHAQTGEHKTLSCQGVFASIGRDPASSLYRGQIELDAQGYVLADASTRTSLPGVFAAGDVRAKPLRQIVTATADGAVAAYFAQAYLSGSEAT